MYVYFDKSGTLKEIISEPTRQGNSNFNKIYLYWENKPSVSTYWVTFKKPDKTFTNETEVNTFVSKSVPYNKKRDLKFFKEYQNYSFLEINVPDEVLSQNGLALCSVRAVLNENTTETLGMITFNVEESAVQFDSYITESQYNYLIELVGDKATWSDIENYIGVSRTDVVPYTNFVGYLKDVVFKQNTDDIQTLFTLYNSILGNKYEVVNALPAQGSVNTLYWLNIGDNLYDIYIYQNGEYTRLFANVNFNPNDFASKTDFETNSANKLTYEDDGFTLNNQKGEEIPNQSDKVQLPQINSKRLVGDYDIEVFEAGGEVDNAQDTNHRTPKEAMLEPYTIDITDKTTLNYAEYNILIRQTQNYLIYNNIILRFEYDVYQSYYCYYGDFIEVRISKTENSDRSHNIVVKRLNRVGKMFITGTNIYVSAIIALDNTAKGDSIRIVPGDYVATGTYNGKTVYKLRLSASLYREVYLTDGSTEVVGEADVSVEEL